MLNSTCTKVSYLLCTSLIHSSTSTLHSLLAIFTSETKLGSGGRWGARLTVPAGEVVVWSSAIAPDLDPEQRYHRHHCGVWSAIWKIVLNASQILHNYYNVSKKCIVYYVNLLYKHIWLKSDIAQRNFHPSSSSGNNLSREVSSHLPQLIQGDAKSFPWQQRDIVLPVCLGSATGFPPGGTPWNTWPERSQWGNL